MIFIAVILQFYGITNCGNMAAGAGPLIEALAEGNMAQVVMEPPNPSHKRTLAEYLIIERCQYVRAASDAIKMMSALLCAPLVTFIDGGLAPWPPKMK